MAYLLCLLDQCLLEKLPGDVLYNTTSLLQALVDGHSTNLHFMNGKDR